MNDIKKTVKTTGIWCLALIALNVLSLLGSIFEDKIPVFDVVTDVTEIILSLVTGIIFLCVSKKSNEEILKKNKLFLTLAIVNILNNLIVWLIVFCAYLSINKEIKHKKCENKENACDDVDEKAGSDKEIVKSAESLTTKLEELSKLKEKNLISNEEYETLRQQAIQAFINDKE